MVIIAHMIEGITNVFVYLSTLSNWKCTAFVHGCGREC